MRLIPVLDVLSGRAVLAVGGDRAHYQPLRSILHEGSDPVATALAFRDRLNLREMYLADLDAIGGAAPALTLYRSLAQLGLSLWVDAGLKDEAHASALLAAGVSTIVAGLETLKSPDELAKISAICDPQRVVFSLDLRNGAPLGSWNSKDPVEIARRAVDAGAGRILLLDVAGVGTSAGVRTFPCLQTLRERYPQVELSCGGGVRGVDDLRRLAACGVDAVLIASAFHDGRIGRNDCRRLSAASGRVTLG
jgi:phosphoribosylformimino-5-aminoimidazole carboxamide ribotide isomerase